MNNADFIKQLQRHEGYRDKVYVDTEGNLTCGWGHCLHVGSSVPEQASFEFFKNDLAIVNRDYRNLGVQLDPVREYAIKNMLFNLGLSKLLGFKKMLAALKAGDFKKSACEMIDSKWSEQVGGRAVELAQMILTGRYRNESRE